MNLFPTLTFNRLMDLDLECHLDIIDSFQCEGRPDLFYACMRLKNMNLFSVSCFLGDSPFPTAAAAENKKMLFQIALILLCCNCSEQFNLDLIAF